jgi:hypothetical protein
MVKKPSTIDISDTSIERHRKFSQRIRVECEIDTIKINEKRNHKCNNKSHTNGKRGDICQSPKPSKGSIDLTADCANMITPINIRVTDSDRIRRDFAFLC